MEFIIINWLWIGFYDSLWKYLIFYKTSKLTSLSGAEELLSGTPEEVFKKLNEDSAYAFGKKIHTTFYNEIEPKFQELNMQIVAVQKEYMKALMEVFPNE